MSDYEATAYLSLEKLKVSKVYNVDRYQNCRSLGETHAGVLTVSRQDSSRVTSSYEVLERSLRAARQRS